MTAEGSGEVVVLAMNIVGNCSTDSYIFCSGSDGQKESARYGEVEDLSQRDPCLAAQYTRAGVETQKAVHAARLQQRATLQQTDVAIAAPCADGQYFCGGR